VEVQLELAVVLALMLMPVLVLIQPSQWTVVECDSGSALVSPEAGSGSLSEDSSWNRGVKD
jgi:hypothetical protein